MHSIRFGLAAAFLLVATSPLVAVAGTHAADALRDGERHAGVIVHYVDPVAPRDARSVQARATSLFSNAVARANVAGARLAQVRRSVAGDVMQFEQPLDRQEMTRLMRELAADPRVARVEPDLVLTHTAIARATTPPSDPGFATQWHFHDPVAGINAPQAWSITAGAGKIVAVVDTGVVPHADMSANVLPGYDFISQRWRSGRPTEGRAPGGIDLGDWSDPGECLVKGNESSWHGTHVAGTIAQVTGNAHMGAGAAHGAKVLPVRVLGRCGGILSDIVDGIVWAAGGDVPGVPANATPAEVLNLSLGGPSACPIYMQEAIDGAVARGSTVVVAAGNSDRDASLFTPANCRNVIVVGASGLTGRRAFYSNHGDIVTVAAPGGGTFLNDQSRGNLWIPGGFIWSTVNSGATVPESPRMGGMYGTSMAAPHVAAIVAMMQSVAPTPLTPAKIATLLADSARMFPMPIDKKIGSGIVDAGLAVEAAKLGYVPVAKPADLSSNAPVQHLQAKAAQTRHFAINVPENATRLTFRSYAGTGDADLYVRLGQHAFPDAYDAKSVRPGNNGVVVINAPAAGKWHIAVHGTKAYSGVSLMASVE